MAPPVPLGIDAQAVSGITGSISLACWIIVFAPQIYENFIRKSSEGLSLLFVILWLAGDIFNVLGAILQGVLPTMIILAIYYTLADIVLLWQCLVYGMGRAHNNKVDPIHLSPANPLNEHDNLLESALSNEDDQEEDIDMCSDEEDMASFIDTNGNASDDLAYITRQKNSTTRAVFYNTLMVMLVLISGIFGYYISNKGKSHHHDDDQDHTPELIFDPLAQFFGWLCAILYLGSRIPQILLNFKRKSCDGISFMFFLFACLGNLTYVVSILCVDTSKNYLLINSSWLAGSLGTLFLDFVIFVQFFIYNENGIDGDSSSEGFTDSESTSINDVPAQAAQAAPNNYGAIGSSNV